MADEDKCEGDEVTRPTMEEPAEEFIADSARPSASENALSKVQE